MLSAARSSDDDCIARSIYRDRVCVIIPTYNRSGLVVQALESVLHQTRRPDEIIIIDDGSEDDTAEALERYRHQITYLRQSNAGKSAALNRAMTSLIADYVWIIDDDDVALPDALERHLAFLDAHRWSDFTYSSCYQFSGDEIPMSPKDLELDDHYPEPARDELLLFCLTVWPFFIQGMLVPLACYRKVGPFDESLVAGEDHDMIVRLAREFQGGKVAGPTFMLRVHDGARGPSYERHAANDRHAVWRRYDVNLFTKIHSSLGLHEYLPRGSADPVLTVPQRRRALFKRASVMARRGLFRFAVEDLIAATNDMQSRTAPYSPEEHLMISQLMDIDPARLRKQWHFVGSVGGIIRRRAPTVFWSALKGLSWSLKREMRKRNYPDAAALLVAFTYLIITSKLPLVTRSFPVSEQER